MGGGGGEGCCLAYIHYNPNQGAADLGRVYVLGRWLLGGGIEQIVNLNVLLLPPRSSVLPQNVRNLI